MVTNSFVGLSGRQAAKQIKSLLEQAGISPEDSSFEGSFLVKMVQPEQNSYLDVPLTEEQAKELQQLCEKRCQRVPLQYLAGNWDFLDFTLKVGPGVLIPREDTYTLCLAAADSAPRMGAQADENFAALLGGWPQADVENPPLESREVTILDLCGGTGCVGLGILRMIPQAKVLAVEKSSEAFAYLCTNTKDTSVTPVKEDVFGLEKKLPAQSVWVLAANPPYVTGDEMKQLAPELAYEPPMALYAEEEGLAFYRYFAKFYPPVLKKGGWMVFEIGASQGEAVKTILQEAGASFVQVLQDDGGRDRVVRGCFLS